MRPCACARCCDSAHITHVQRQFRLTRTRITPVAQALNPQQCEGRLEPSHAKNVFRSNIDCEEPDQPVKLYQVFAHKVNNAGVRNAFCVSLNRTSVDYFFNINALTHFSRETP